MKIRNGFISNSSSSSFLVAWDKRPRKLADVLKYVPDREEAKLLFKRMKFQDGVYLCNLTDKCKACDERFRCFTGGGRLEELTRLVRIGGWIDYDCDEYEEDNTWALEIATKFFEENRGKVAYCFRIADWGESAESDTEAEMRKGLWLDGIPCHAEVWD